MTKTKRPSDINVTAFETLKAVTGEPTEAPRNGKPTKHPPKPPIPIKNPAAVSLGRLGGLLLAYNSSLRNYAKLRHYLDG